MTSQWTARRGRGDPRRRGQVLILTIIAITLLAGLVFYAYNVGDQVNRRLELQGAADSAAITGATWMARNMNVVAMNNVGTAKMLSLVPILDTQPLASKMAYEEVKAWEEALAGIGRQGRIDPHITSRTETYLREGVENLRGRMETQRDILEPYQAALNADFDMETITHWARQGTPGAPPHGQLWRAAMTMEEFSRAAVQTCGVLAQERASRMGRRNGATASFIVPVAPEMPARMGHYNDFQPTIEGICEVRSETASMEWSGGNGGAIPDHAYPHRLGPWARLHRWRDYFRTFIQTGREFIPGTPGAGRTRGSHGNVNVNARRVGRSARSRNDRGRPDHYRAIGYHELVGYRTYGPYEWAKRYLHHWARGTHQDPGRLRDTYYYEYVSRIADIKRGYMFPPDGGAGEATMTKEIHYPVWVPSYPAAKAIGDNPDNDVAYTMCYLVEIASKFPEGSGSFMTPGTFRTNGDYPIAMWMNGWQDPNDWNLPMVSNYVWKDAYVYETTQDSELGIPLVTIPPGDPDGEVVWHPVYMYAWYIFGGIDIGGMVEISNPCNWDAYDHVPAPVLLDTSEGDYGGNDPDVGWRRHRFMMLGVARRRMNAPVWRQRFTHVNPILGSLTVAQAKIFNHESFGLWTQDWRVQLAPVTRLGPETDTLSWTARLQQGVAEAATVEAVEVSEVETAYQYLSAFDADFAAAYLTH